MASEQRVGTCPRCGESVMWAGRGRRRRWCSTACRQRAKEARRVARDNEQPILAVDAPARPRVAEEWVEYLSSMQHRQLLLRVLGAVVQRWNGQVVVPAEADAVVERMFDLPAGSGRALRDGLPLPDAEQRLETRRQELADAERRGYERGRRDERYESISRAREAAVSAAASAAGPPPTAAPGLSRQQRRAQERAARKARN